MGVNAMDSQDHDAVLDAFHAAVNMTPAELDKWLATDESRSVGWTHEGDKEAVGHESGRRIVAIKRTRKAELTDDDYAQMRRVVGYVHRHMAQRPAGDVRETRWRFSLMNWGHDPLKG